MVILAAAGVILAAASFAGGDGTRIVVKANGEIFGTYELNIDREVTVEDAQGHFNRIVIENGQVRMIEADCPNHDCIGMGAISRTNQSIVCLPNKVSVTIEGGEADVDIVTG